MRSVPWSSRSMLSAWASQISAAPDRRVDDVAGAASSGTTSRTSSIAGNIAADPSSDPSET